MPRVLLSSFLDIYRISFRFYIAYHSGFMLFIDTYSLLLPVCNWNNHDINLSVSEVTQTYGWNVLSSRLIETVARAMCIHLALYVHIIRTYNVFELNYVYMYMCMYMYIIYMTKVRLILFVYSISLRYNTMHIMMYELFELFRTW